MRSPEKSCQPQPCAPCSGARSPKQRSRQWTRQDSSPDCASPGWRCGCGLARLIRVRSPDTPSRSPATPAPTGHCAGTAAGNWPPGLPLRHYWAQRSAAVPPPPVFRLTDPDRARTSRLASRRVATAAEHIRRCAYSNPAAAADAAWAAADTLHVAARALRSPVLRRAADAYDRAARAPYGRIPRRGRDGDALRATARLLAIADDLTGGATLLSAALMANLP